MYLLRQIILSFTTLASTKSSWNGLRMDRYKQDQRRHKLFNKLDDDPNAMKAKVKTLFKKGHWEGALTTLDRLEITSIRLRS